jgi:hypothetical protein
MVPVAFPNSRSAVPRPSTPGFLPFPSESVEFNRFAIDSENNLSELLRAWGKFQLSKFSYLKSQFAFAQISDSPSLRRLPAPEQVRNLGPALVEEEYEEDYDDHYDEDYGDGNEADLNENAEEFNEEDEDDSYRDYGLFD